MTISYDKKNYNNRIGIHNVLPEDLDIEFAVMVVRSAIKFWRSK